MECNEAPPRDISMLPTLDMVLFKPAHKHDEYDKIMKRSLVTLGFFSLALMLAASFVQAEEKPNIVFILADDLGYGDISCFGQKKLKTPNIDRLATEGIKLTDHYSANTVCTPSRHSLMAGQHAGHCLARGNGDENTLSLLEAMTVLPEVFKAAGYTTGMYGKWGVGVTNDAGRPSPLSHGFDEFSSWKSQMIAHTYYPTSIVRNGKEVALEKDTYIHDLIMNDALAFVKKNAKAGKPFFCYIPTAVPHAAMHAPKALHEKYRKVYPQFDKKIGKYMVPIVPDESRTFGMEGMFRQFGIYAHSGQLYEPVDSELVTYYKEAQDGQILEEGITEAGSMSSFNAAGTAYSKHGINMIPFFIYYSMFGFQRIGDLIWAAADMRAKGFLIGGTAGRTSLNGEGLQHQDGHSLLNAIAFPTVRSYDPAFAYEVVVIIMEGLKKMYQEGEECIYYLMSENDPYDHPEMPEGCEEGIVKGMYKVSTREVDQAKGRVQLFGSGAIYNSVAKAQEILAEKYGVASDTWSVTSYTQLRREADECRRWNMMHPTQPARKSYLETTLDGTEGPFISASDYVKALGEQLTPWIPGDYHVLGTDGMGRSESRDVLRRHFEVDAECVVWASLYLLAKQGKFEMEKVEKAIGELGINPEKAYSLYA